MSLIGSARRASQRFLLFGINIGLLALTSLWFVRAAVGVSSLQTWASIAVGQTVGALGAILVGYGWSIAGPTRVAGQTERERVSEYSDALRIRLLVLPVAASLALGVLFFVPSIDVGTAFLGALPVMIIAISANFYFVGISAPLTLLVVEILPRTMGTAVAAALMSSHLVNVTVGIAFQILGALISIISSAVYILHGRFRELFRRYPVESPRSVVSLLKRQRAGILSAILVNFYSGAPIIIVSFVAPLVLPHFSVVDKLTKQLLAGSSPVTAVLQGWVPRGGPDRIRSRARQAALIGWGVSIAVGAFVALVSSPIIFWLSAGKYVPSLLTQALMGSFVGLFLVQNAVSFSSLAALNRLGLVNRSLAISAPTGLVLVAAMCPSLGVDGALAGVCIGISIAAIWQSVAAFLPTRRTRP